MKTLMINPKTRYQLEAYQKQPTQTLLLYGPTGVGLTTIAQTLARTIAGANRLLVAPRLHKSQKTATINMDDIRQIRQLARDKRTERLVVIIDQADKLTGPTPQALLKLLEEPSHNVSFILTTSNLANLPATITSRAQMIQVYPAPDAQTLLGDVKPASKRRQIEFMAAGLPAEMRRLSADDDYFRTRARVFEQAKTYLSSTTYDRLKIISTFKNRDEAREFVEVLARLVSLLAAKSDQSTRLDRLSQTADNLAANGNIKAQMTCLALTF
jgi:replication-associated recombination protein RarA